MASKEELLNQFEIFNINPSNEVVCKCLEMCSTFNVDAEELVEQWIAFTTSNLRGAAPTVEYLKRMERKEFQKTKEASIASVKNDTESSPYVSVNQQQSFNSTEVLSTPKRNHVPLSRIHTPVQPKRIADDSMEVTMASPGTPSRVYSKRQDAKKIRCSYGPENATFKADSTLNVSVKPVAEHFLNSNQRFMYEVVGKRGKCISDMTEDLITAIEAKHLHKDTEDMEEIIKANTVCCGRIVSDSDGKINSQSVLLELTQKHKGRTIALILSKLLKYSLFPGQVVALKGTYLMVQKMDQFVVEEVFADANFDLPLDPPITEGNLQLVIGCGPFTVQDSLSFEPLNDLLQYVKENKPHVLLLLGPFYERTHQGITNGELGQSFDSFFFDIVDNIMNVLRDTGVHVIIVSSLKEPHHYPVYPTPPYEVRQKYPNLTFASDPCMVSVNGMVVGATTADILFHLTNYEIYLDKTNSGPPDRIGRMASHLLKQQNFYPLDPPYKEVGIDMTLMERFGVMEVKPHFLVLPSNLRHFVKEIDDCVIINPERISKGNGGGTFAKLEVRAGQTRSICGRASVEILNI